jgi:hypothetical protein
MSSAPGAEPGVVAVISEPVFTDWLRTMYALNAHNASWNQTSHFEIAPIIAVLEQEMGG